MLAKAIRIAAVVFEKKKDAGGHPYIFHLLTVMNGVAHLGEDAMIAAVLHDILEDYKDWTQERLAQEGFSYEIIQRISILTRTKGEDYMDYVKRVATDKICVAIKLADLKHNSDISRLKGLTKKDFDRMETYCRAYEYLKKV